MRERKARWLVAAIAVMVGVGSAHADLFKKKKVDSAVTTADASSEVVDWNRPIATVNGQPITRAELANELIATYGDKQLDLMINRKVVELACKDRNIEITKVQLEQEIQTTLKQLNLSRKEFAQRVLGHRGMTFAQYMRDTVWPAVALKSLVTDKVTVTPEDLDKAFEANYGARVDCRMLVVLEQRRATELWEKINKVEKTEEKIEIFEELCKTYSVDAATRPYGGRCQPIHRHSAFPEIEKVAFNLKPGELSTIIEAPEGNLILLCVGHIPPVEGMTLDSPLEGTELTIRQYLEKDIHEKKTRLEVATLFKQIRDAAEVQDFLKGDFDPDAVETLPVSYTAPAPTKETDKKPAGPKVSTEDPQGVQLPPIED